MRPKLCSVLLRMMIFGSMIYCMYLCLDTLNYTSLEMYREVDENIKGGFKSVVAALRFTFGGLIFHPVIAQPYWSLD